MLKKGLVVSGAVVLLLLLLFGGRFCSNVSTAVKGLQDRVEENIPIGFHLDRARHEIARLDPVIRDLTHDIAREEVAVEQLEGQISGSEGQLAAEKEDIMTLTASLDSGSSVHRFVSTGESYTSEQVEKDLARRFERYKSKDEMTKALRQRLDARRARLDGAHEQLEETLSAKRELEVEVANLEAQLKMIEVAKTANEFSYDNSQLAKARNLINDVKTRIEVEAKLVNAEETLEPGIKLDEPENRNIRDEVTNYFEPIDTQFAESSK